MNYCIKCFFFINSLSESLTWSRPKVQGKPPAARDGHSACVIESRIYIFGGYEEEVQIVNFDIIFRFCNFYIVHVTRSNTFRVSWCTLSGWNKRYCMLTSVLED